VQANILASEKGGDLYNVARGETITINELARKVVKFVGSESLIKHEAPRPGDIKHSKADISKITGIGFKPRTDLDRGLQKTVEYFMDLLKKEQSQ
jgi:UDP-glucose 4-epimerase